MKKKLLFFSLLKLVFSAVARNHEPVFRRNRRKQTESVLHQGSVGRASVLRWSLGYVFINGKSLGHICFTEYKYYLQTD